MTTLLIILIIVLLIATIYERYRRTDAYWDGRLAGWKACELLILDRAKETGTYSTALKLLQ